MSAHILRSYFEGKDGDEFRFRVLVSKRFQKRISKAEAFLRQQIDECILDLIDSLDRWKQRKVKKAHNAPPTRSVKMARVNNNDIRLIFAGPLSSDSYHKPVLFVHDFCGHDKLRRFLKNITGYDLSEGDFYEFEASDILESSADELSNYDQELVAFAKWIPASYFLDAEKVDSILESEKASIHLTEKQLQALDSKRPLLIHGEAGTGKTTILCHRLALSIVSQRQRQVREPILYLSYNQRLVEQAKKDVQEILRGLYQRELEPSDCQFLSFQDFLRHAMGTPEPRFLNDENYISFGDFRHWYSIYSRGAKKLPSVEFAWHIIRSLLKGSSIPPSSLPIDRERYQELGRRRQEVDPSEFESFYEIGLWYQNKLKEEGFWDDLELAWEALRLIQERRKQNPLTLPRYAEIFCDEAQDLTELEFKILLALCRPPARYSGEGVPLLLAGDPLQTIHPTGFRWSVLRSAIYHVNGNPVQLHQLQENWRSSRRIVALANGIQKIRSAYLEQQFSPQSAFEKEEADYPRLVLANDAVMTTISDTLAYKLKARSSAVILWDEENEAITQFLRHDSILGHFSQDISLQKLDKAMAEHHLYTVSDAKGLEFKIVILYKVATHPEVKRWWDWMEPNLTLSQDEQIPLLYLLNRLYISITRAQSYLFIVDTPDATENFWSQWMGAEGSARRPSVPANNGGEGIIRLKSAADFEQFIEQHATLSPIEWEEEGDKQFEHAEHTKYIRDYERALFSYRNAKADKKATQTEARIAYLTEEWESAGELYLHIEQPYKAADCFERGQKWKRAISVYEQLPEQSLGNRRLAYCRFRHGCSEPELDCRQATLVFSQAVDSDEGIGQEAIWEVADKLSQLKEIETASTHYERLYRQFGDIKAAIEHGKCCHRVQQYDKAIAIFEACHHEGSEYLQSLQEKANSLREANELREAADTYGKLGQWRRGAYREQALCLYDLADYGAALSAFRESGEQSLERQLCQAEIALQEGNLLKAIQIFNAHKQYKRTIEVVKRPIKRHLMPDVATAHYQLKEYDAAERLFARLTKGERDSEKRHQYYILQADCQVELGRKEEAIDSYANGQAYDKAILLALELAQPEQLIKELRATKAEKEGDLDLAITLRTELGEELKVAKLQGERAMNNGQYREASKYFLQAKEVGLFLTCLANKQLSAREVRSDLLRALIGMPEGERTRIRQWIIKQDDSLLKEFISFVREQAEEVRERAQEGRQRVGEGAMGRAGERAMGRAGEREEVADDEAQEPQDQAEAQARARNQETAKRLYEEVAELQLMVIRAYQKNNQYHKIIEMSMEQNLPTAVIIFAIETLLTVKQYKIARQLFSKLTLQLKDKTASRFEPVLQKAIQLGLQVGDPEDVYTLLVAISRVRESIKQ